MPSFELRIRPPFLAIIAAIVMWCIALVAPASGVPALRSLWVVILAVCGVALAVAGVRTFRQAKTTTTSMDPKAASSLVVSGVYRFTRNPMYLGMCVLLVAWAAYLWSAWALLGPIAFVVYTTRFQIAPEERALSALFGSEYTAYKAKVRRWL